jgi:hypothetical protein
MMTQLADANPIMRVRHAAMDSLAKQLKKQRSDESCNSRNGDNCQKYSGLYNSLTAEMPVDTEFLRWLGHAF